MLTFYILFFIFLSIKTEDDDSCLPKACTKNEECQHYGYCNTAKKKCCLGHYGECTYPGSQAIRPQIDCITDDDCGSSYCDWRMKICCSEGDSPEGYCPNQVTLLGVEPFCGGVDGGDEKCPEDSTCYMEHCCPKHNTTGNTVIPLSNPYPLRIRCRQNEAPPFRNTFCQRDTNRSAIMGEFRVNETKNVNTGRLCRTNQDCSLSTVCIFTSQIGQCYIDPFSPDLSIDLADPLWITFYVLFPVFWLLFGVLILIYKWKQKIYYSIPE